MAFKERRELIAHLLKQPLDMPSTMAEQMLNLHIPLLNKVIRGRSHRSIVTDLDDDVTRKVNLPVRYKNMKRSGTVVNPPPCVHMPLGATQSYVHRFKQYEHMIERGSVSLHRPPFRKNSPTTRSPLPCTMLPKTSPPHRMTSAVTYMRWNLSGGRK